MSKQTKYELASQEVQEVMTKPPHLLILWGNTFILVIIASALLLLNFITLPRYVWFSYQIVKQDSSAIALVTDKDIYKLQLKSIPIQLPVTGEKNRFESFMISSIQKNTADQSVITLMPGNEKANATPATIKNYSEGKILIEQVSLFERIMQQFRRR